MNMAAVRKEVSSSKENQARGKEKESRKSLQSLQVSAKGETLVGKGRIQIQKGKNKQIKSSQNPVIVFSDSEISTKADHVAKKRTRSLDFSILEERSTQTDEILEDVFIKSEADREALELMGGEQASETYWKILAEERRKALNDTLEENEELYKEIESLREENLNLTGLAEKASYLSNILQEILTDDDDDDDSVEKNAVKDNETKLKQQKTVSLDNDENSSLNTSKMFLSENLVTSSPVHTILHKKINSTSFQDCSPKISTAVQNDGDVHADDQCDNKTVVCSENDDWINVELENDMVTSTELVISEKLAEKNSEKTKIDTKKYRKIDKNVL